ncbi:hypothetical protein JB92DRAFT_2829900 [Gautieria morchelliformis]|nr:hypothetical protein JB92DRAFT_2829900 [Gautieria morchelliformis]
MSHRWSTPQHPPALYQDPSWTPQTLVHPVRLKQKRVDLSPSNKPNAYEERKERKMKLIAEWALKASEGTAADQDQEDKVDSCDTIENLEKIGPLVKMKNKAERELLESHRTFLLGTAQG